MRSLLRGPAQLRVKNDHQEREQQQHTARGRKFLKNCPEKLLRDFHPPPAPLGSLFWSGIDFTGVQAIAGAGIGTKLVPELVEFKPVGNPPPTLVRARGKTLSARRLRLSGLRCR